MIPPLIQLASYAEHPSGALERVANAQRLVAELLGCQSNWIELDFTGVSGIGEAFCVEFFRLAASELADVWLLPCHYRLCCNHMVKRLQERVKRQREAAWMKGCERFTTGNHPT